MSRTELKGKCSNSYPLNNAAKILADAENF